MLLTIHSKKLIVCISNTISKHLCTYLLPNVFFESKNEEDVEPSQAVHNVSKKPEKEQEKSEYK